MFIIKLKYKSGRSDVGQCATEDEARETLALASGYSIATARLLPFSVDGLILASSTALLTGARPGLARAGLVLGIVATLGANVAAGAEFGVVGALVNAWPAVAFIMASEILLSTVRAARDLPSAEGAAGTVAGVIPTAPVSTPQTVAANAPATVLKTVAGRASKRAPVSNVHGRLIGTRRTAPSGRSRAGLPALGDAEAWRWTAAGMPLPGAQRPLRLTLPVPSP